MSQPSHVNATPVLKPVSYFPVNPGSWVKAGTSIGIAWRAEGPDPRRSVPVHLAASLVEEVPFDVEVLQQDLTPNEMLHFPAARARSLAVIVDVVHNLDLVIAVDSLLARIAIALQRPTWLLKAAGVDWHSTSPEWASANCPALRIYQQSHLGDWSDVVRRVADDLSFCCQGDSLVLS